MSRRRFTFSAVLIAVLFPVVAAAQTPANEAVIKAAFVYNFLKFVEWPTAAFATFDGPLVVAIVGEGATAKATEQFLAAKQVGGRPILVRRVRWDEPFTGVHAAYLAEKDHTKMGHAIASAAKAHVLSIGEGAAFAARGGVIGLFVEERKVRFDIDLNAADASGLRISSKLLALTRTVHPSRQPSAGRQ